MKPLILALRMFRKNLMINLVVVFSLALIAAATMIYMNMYRASTASIRILEQSPYRIIYYMSRFEYEYASAAGEGKEAEVAEKIDNIFHADIKKAKGLRGYSKINRAFGSTDKGFLQGAYTAGASAEVVIMDQVTTGIMLSRLSVADDFAEYNKTGKGDIPCVIGGKSAYRYREGDGFSVYTYTKDGADNVELKVRVAGRLEKPEKVFGLSTGSTNAVPASELFWDCHNNNLIIVFPERVTEQIGSRAQRNHLLYFNGGMSDAELTEQAAAISGSYINTDTQMIAGEKARLDQTFSLIFPFVIMLLLVSITEVVTICLLNVLKNLRTFSVYYACGCSWKRGILIAGLYSGIFFILAGGLFYAMMRLLYIGTYPKSEQIYFMLSGVNPLLTAALCLAVGLVSFILPFIILKRYKPIEKLRFE